MPWGCRPGHFSIAGAEGPARAGTREKPPPPAHGILPLLSILVTAPCQCTLRLIPAFVPVPGAGPCSLSPPQGLVSIPSRRSPLPAAVPSPRSLSLFPILVSVPSPCPSPHPRSPCRSPLPAPVPAPGLGLGPCPRSPSPVPPRSAAAAGPVSHRGRLRGAPPPAAASPPPPARPPLPPPPAAVRMRRRRRRPGPAAPVSLPVA